MVLKNSFNFINEFLFYSVDQIRKIFLEPEVAKIDKIEFGETDYEGIVKYLSEERDFSKDRVETSMNRLKKSLEKKSQTLDQFF